ncbi:MAG: PcfB family protein [Lachnospiraceae bacterium]|nr:PcfB family protein [Lachnospiraceae bacterium]
MGTESQEAEFVVRLALQGMNYVMQISGQGAVHIAAMIQAIKNQPDTSPGKKRLATMLKSGESLRVFTIMESNLQEFALEAKRYGCQYCIAELSGENVALGTYDLLVKDTDAVRINHIIEKLKLASVEGKVDTDLTEEQQKGAIELTDAQKLMQDLFSPNKEERIEAERNNPGAVEPEEIQSQSEGSYKSTDNRTSIRLQLNENQIEVDSTRDMFTMARELRVNMMSPGASIDDEKSMIGWEPPERNYNESGEMLYRGKTADEMTPRDQVQYMVDEEMFSKGKLSEEFIGRLYEAGYMVNEKGFVEELDTNLTNRERKLIVDMMHDPGEDAKTFNDIREAINHGDAK